MTSVRMWEGVHFGSKRTGLAVLHVCHRHVTMLSFWLVSPCVDVSPFGNPAELHGEDWMWSPNSFHLVLRKKKALCEKDKIRRAELFCSHRTTGRGCRCHLKWHTCCPQRADRALSFTCSQNSLGFAFLLLDVGRLVLWENGFIIIFFIPDFNDKPSRFKGKWSVISTWTEEVWLIQVNIGSFAFNFGVHTSKNKDDFARIIRCHVPKMVSSQILPGAWNSSEPRSCKMNTWFFFSNSNSFWIVQVSLLKGCLFCWSVIR